MLALESFSLAYSHSPSAHQSFGSVTCRHYSRRCNCFFCVYWGLHSLFSLSSVHSIQSTFRSASCRRRYCLQPFLHTCANMNFVPDVINGQFNRLPSTGFFIAFSLSISPASYFTGRTDYLAISPPRRAITSNDWEWNWESSFQTPIKGGRIWRWNEWVFGFGEKMNFWTSPFEMSFLCNYIIAFSINLPRVQLSRHAPWHFFKYLNHSNNFSFLLTFTSLSFLQVGKTQLTLEFYLRFTCFPILLSRLFESQIKLYIFLLHENFFFLRKSTSWTEIYIWRQQKLMRKRKAW